MINIIICALGIIAGVVINTIGFVKSEYYFDNYVKDVRIAKLITNWLHVRVLGCFVIAVTLVGFFEVMR